MMGIDKWSSINCTINENQIAILALQETHMDQALMQDVLSCFRKRLEIVHLQHLTNPCATVGVAFIINKALIKPREYKMYKLQEGRVIALKVKWLENEETTLVNIYTPNNRAEHPAFWEMIETRTRVLNLCRPDFMLGDFNLTEENINRAPARQDDLSAIEVLRLL
jgi:exonuclease III